jgi:hypothetical protein
MMCLQKVISKRTQKKLFFVSILKVTDEKSGSGSVSQRYGYEDPDPYENVRDPEQWKKRKLTNAIDKIETKSQCEIYKPYLICRN